MKTDIVILGGGPGGYVAAIKAAQLGYEVILVEKSKLGGTCLNEGCIPTKVFYKNASLIEDIKRSEEFGIFIHQYSYDMKAFQERKDDVIQQLVRGIHQLFKANGVKLIEGKGKLLDPNLVEVTTELETIRIEAKHIIIATGSKASRPPIEGIDSPSVLTSKELLQIEETPTDIVIIGGGVIGVEFASILNALGTKVTIIEFMNNILPHFDMDISKRLALSLKKKGITIHTGTAVRKINEVDNRCIVYTEGKKEITIACEQVLVATGRSINIEGLGLDTLGITYDHKGIEVNKYYQTNIPSVYAIGDVIGNYMLAHVASEEGIKVIEGISGEKVCLDYNAIPSLVFTFPEVASVGLTEEEAKRQDITYQTSKFLFGANGKALTMGEKGGFVKIIASKEDDLILGVHIMGPHASDLIHEPTLAIKNKLSLKSIEDTLHAHPSLSEAFHEGIMGIHNRAIHIVPKSYNKK